MIYKGYKMKYDFHTHTHYSRNGHGKGSIYENVLEAKNKGLEAVAISDHGPGHLFYGIQIKDVENMRREIGEAKKKVQGIDVYLSVEANIIDFGTGIDVPPEAISKFDFIIAGYHFGVRRGHFCTNYLDRMIYREVDDSAVLRGCRKKRMLKNTDMTLKAIYENDIKILTHPGEKYPIDIKEVAKACGERKTLMEISTWHSHMTLEEIRKAAIYDDVEFVISSDAHHPSRVGSFYGGLDRAIEAGLDLNRIVNIERN